MYVADVEHHRPVEEALAALDGGHSVLVHAPVGFGKTSVLASIVASLEQATPCRTAWVHGRSVASQGHLERVVGAQLESTTSKPKGIGRYSRRDSLSTSILLAVDDLDVLTFKKMALALSVLRMIRGSGRWRLIASCHSSAVERLTNAWREIAGEDEVATIPIRPLSESAAVALLSRRAPRLNVQAYGEVVREADGHPAALVFLGHVLERDGQSGSSPSDRIASAVEFAGAVYAEAWASIGPQQRAILTVLGWSERPLSAGLIADAVVLTPSHVSAQLTRLQEAGLVRPADQRAHFTIAPLLSRWIKRRAPVIGEADSVLVPRVSSTDAAPVG